MLDKFVAIDLETTGLNAQEDKIIEIGAVQFEGGVVCKEFHTYVNPGIKLKDTITALTGIKDERLHFAPDFKDIMLELKAFLNEDVLIGHRILFDYSFLKQAFSFYKQDFSKKGIDTLKLARKNLPALKSKRLEDLCHYYQIPLDAHRALQDANAAGVLYLKMVKEFKMAAEAEPEILNWNRKKVTPATKAQKEQLFRLLKMSQLETDFDMTKLTRAEASRKIETILQKIRIKGD